MQTLSLSIVIEQDKNGFFAWCPSLQGCMTEGRSYEEARENIEDAIQLYLADMKRTPPTSTGISITMVTIAISSAHAKTAKAHRH